MDFFYKTAGAILAPFRYAQREIENAKETLKEDARDAALKTSTPERCAIPHGVAEKHKIFLSRLLSAKRILIYFVLEQLPQ